MGNDLVGNIITLYLLYLLKNVYLSLRKEWNRQKYSVELFLLYTSKFSGLTGFPEKYL